MTQAPKPPGRQRWLWVASLAAVAITGAALLVEHFLPDHSFLHCALTYLPQAAWMVAPGLLLFAAALRRSLPALALNAVLLVVAAVSLGGYTIATGSSGPEDSDEETVRVMTWNVHNEAGEGEAIVAEVSRADPDILCLQEAWRVPVEDLLVGWHVAAVHGLRICSRHEMLDVQVFGRRGAFGRPWLACRVRTPAGTVVVLNVHMTSAKAAFRSARTKGSTLDALGLALIVRDQEFQALAEAIPDAAPVVVAGDFNTPPSSEPYRLLSDHLTDAFAATRFGTGLTYLAFKRLPAWRIDYVWCGNGIRPVHCTLGGPGPSDHRPVITDLIIPGPQ